MYKPKKPYDLYENAIEELSAGHPCKKFARVRKPKKWADEKRVGDGCPWVIMNFNEGQRFECRRCGGSYPPRYPIPIRMLVALSRAFLTEHRHCRANHEPNKRDPSAGEAGPGRKPVSGDPGPHPSSAR